MSYSQSNSVEKDIMKDLKHSRQMKNYEANNTMENRTPSIFSQNKAGLPLLRSIESEVKLGCISGNSVDGLTTHNSKKGSQSFRNLRKFEIQIPRSGSLQENNESMKQLMLFDHQGGDKNIIQQTTLQPSAFDEVAPTITTIMLHPQQQVPKQQIISPTSQTQPTKFPRTLLRDQQQAAYQ